MTSKAIATIGADVETFLYSRESGRYEPCVNIFPGTKDNPHQVPGMKSGFCIQEDCVALEWNIPPATTPSGFYKNVGAIRRKVYELAAEKMYDVQYTDSITFASEQLASAQAQTFGCEPDFDAYTGGEMRTVPKGLAKSNVRGAGGHIHVGGDFQCPDFVVALFMDLVVGVGIGLGYGMSARKSWYGKPGIYRPKTYGIEYRTPGPEWAASDESAITVGKKVLDLSRWLSTTDASEIQAAFSHINWRRVNAWMSHHSSGSLSRSRERTQILAEAKMKGVPV